MTGAEHYEQAEKLLEQVKNLAGDYATLIVARAQAHATLAVTRAILEREP